MVSKSKTPDQMSQELLQLEKQMERRWYDLAMAEQQGKPAQVLERLYDTYLRALNSYIAYQRRVTNENPSGRLAS
jgi:hypothetical protein